MHKLLTLSLFVFLSFIALLSPGKCNAQCSPVQANGGQQLCPGDSVQEGNTYIKTPGRYVFHFTLPGGCDSELIFVVTYKLLPAPFLDTAVCTGNPVTLNALDTGAVYAWSNGDTTQTVTATIPGLYTVNVSYHSCTLTDSMRISPLPVIHLTSDTIICNGRGTPLNPTGSSADAYLWYPTTGLSCTACTNPVASPTITTTYSVLVNNGNCFNNGQVTIKVVPVNFSPGVMEAATDTICQGQTGNLTLTGDSGTIHWQFSTSGKNYADVSGQPGNNYLPALSQTTWFRVYSGNGICSDTSNVIKIIVVPYASDTFNATVVDTLGLKIAFSPTITSGIIRYVWTFGDTATSGQIVPTHLYKQFKNYDVCLTAYNSLACSSTFCKVIGLVNLGVAPVNTGDGLTIYPNPAQDRVTIKTSENISANTQIDISDLLGHTVYNTTLSNRQTEINTANLSPGIYFISLYSDGNTIVKKLVKQ